MQPKYGSTSLCDQNCGVQSLDRHTSHVRRTDKSLKTEGPKILSKDILYFRTVIIGGPIICLRVDVLMYETTEIYGKYGYEYSNIANNSKVCLIDTLILNNIEMFYMITNECPP